uniref:FBA_2 domain-containing protein n=1 Tax=Caenorhabditis tropicalis TaxID=1561998 RepID=A0A1I7TKY6_9PELO
MALPLLKLPFLAYEKVLLNFELADIKEPHWVSTLKPVNNMKVAFDYVRDLLRLPITSYHIWNKEQNLFPQWFGITKCDELSMHLSHGFSNDELKHVLEKVEISKKLDLNLPRNLVFDCGFVQFSMDELRINQASWITNETFLAMNCARIELSGNGNLPIRDFVSRWLSSRNTRFESLKMAWYRERINWNEGFKTMKWNPATRGRNFKLNNYYRLDCENGIDILRDDGLLATVVEKYGGIHFVVWHKRFQPEADQLQLDYWF